MELKCVAQSQIVFAYFTFLQIDIYQLQQRPEHSFNSCGALHVLCRMFPVGFCQPLVCISNLSLLLIVHPIC